MSRCLCDITDSGDCGKVPGADLSAASSNSDHSSENQPATAYPLKKHQLSDCKPATSIMKKDKEAWSQVIHQPNNILE